MPPTAKSGARQKSRQALPIDIPGFQNWDCHGCTSCCRAKMSIDISAEEKQRIEGQSWTLTDGVDPEGIFVATSAGFRLGRYRYAGWTQ